VAKETKTRKTGATRTNDPERTKADIIEVATQEFSERGYSGGRVDEIAERTRTSKRMIYYYFDSKDGLYHAVLMEYYGKLRDAEQELHLEDKPPLEAIRKLVEFTYDWHMSHPEGVRLVMVENIHRARHLAALPSIEPVNVRALRMVQGIVERGIAEGVIRKDVDPVQLYLSIASLCFFNVSNRYTISTIFGHDMGSEEMMPKRRKAIVDMVLRSLVSEPSNL
jgi:AcrR family transcriptional regulator